MKVYVALDAERYPMPFVDTDTGGYAEDELVDLPDDLVARYKAAEAGLFAASTAIEEHIAASRHA